MKSLKRWSICSDFRWSTSPKYPDSLTITFAHLEYTAGTYLNKPHNFIKMTQYAANSSNDVYTGFKPMVVTRTSVGIGDSLLGQDYTDPQYANMVWYLGGPASFTFKILNQ